MNARRFQLALARERLIERSRTLRLTAVEQSEALGPALRLVERARAGADWVRTHPAVVAAVFVGLAVARPRRLWRWGLRLWGGWRLLQQLQRRLQVR